MTPLKQQIFDKISNIVFNNGQKVVSLVSEIVIKGKDIGFSIDVAGKSLAEAENVREKIIEQIKQIQDIGKITVILTSDTKNTKNIMKAKRHIDGAKKIILVAAGKGGVGKSTITALIAEQLQLEGYKVGVVDADIYGPSIPQIFGVNQKPKIINKKMVPLKSRNIEIISIGFLTEDNSAIAWRGPMASKAIYQLLSLTEWGDLDYLIVDTPPGTGDIHLSILENYLIDGVVIVTTPQKIAEIDVKKAIDLYKKFNAPILGIIENMSYFIDSSNNKINLFTGNSGESLAAKYNIPLICQFPINPVLSKHCDEGKSLAEFADRLLFNFRVW